ncbi:MAG: hypothetical protein IH859_02085 [Chloroflexi bacterium]|nr:hypothetical protein [Chloroflexota bacterium]
MGLQILQNLESEERIEIPQQVHNIYGVIEKRFAEHKDWKRMHESTLWKQLCLCILSSNVNFESAKSALKHLTRTGFLNSEFILNKSSSQKIIACELAKPLYLPQKIDGTLRKYRFPKIRSKNIVDAAFTIYGDGVSLRNTLHDLSSEIDARNFIAKNISGLGLKESSHFLRNIKFSTSLAIIDVHIVSFLEDLGLILFDKRVISQNEYLLLERLMQKISELNGMNLSILDNAIWYYMKYR